MSPCLRSSLPVCQMACFWKGCACGALNNHIIQHKHGIRLTSRNESTTNRPTDGSVQFGFECERHFLLDKVKRGNISFCFLPWAGGGVGWGGSHDQQRSSVHRRASVIGSTEGRSDGGEFQLDHK